MIPSQVKMAAVERRPTNVYDYFCIVQNYSNDLQEWQCIFRGNVVGYNEVVIEFRKHSKKKKRNIAFDSVLSCPTVRF